MIKLIYLAAGCFWGVQFQLAKLPGIVSTEVGYIGGHTESPTYEDVCRGNTGHFEAVKLEYDDAVVSSEDVLKLYFEIHDFEQADGQGPDLGWQYLSRIFYTDDEQRQVASTIIDRLRAQTYQVRTLLEPAPKFWPAETYHQNYYEKKGGQPYCHTRRKIF